MFKSLTGCIEIADTAELSKQDIRIKVWHYLSENDIARFPLPPTNRIPNFEGAGECGQKVAALPIFSSSHTIKVNPDKPQEEVRFLTLQARKKLLVPTPRLKQGLFNLLENENDDAKTLRKKSQSEGVKHLSKPISLENTPKVDLIVIGSVAVSATGRRIGKGEGFADFEYAMMRNVSAVDDNVIVITTVHDCQVFDDLPERLFLDHDVPVDVIVTPTQIINVPSKMAKPKGIYWHLLSVEKFLQIPVLRVLYEEDERNGVDVSLLNGVLPPEPEEIESYQELRTQRREGRGYRGNRGRRGRGRGRGFYPRDLHEGEQEEGEGAVERTSRGRGRVQMRGRGGRRANSATAEGDSEQQAKTSNIQVTINISKQNKIVRRSVEETQKQDRLATTGLPGDRPSTSSEMRPRRKRQQPTFTFFVGGIPRHARVHDLKAELSNHGVRPSELVWKGSNGFAFLNFLNDPTEMSHILESLKGLSVNDKTLTVDVASRSQGKKVVGRNTTENDPPSLPDLEDASVSSQEESAPVADPSD